MNAIAKMFSDLLEFFLIILVFLLFTVPGWVILLFTYMMVMAHQDHS